MKKDERATQPREEQPRQERAPRKRFTEPTLERHERLPEVTGFSF